MIDPTLTITIDRSGMSLGPLVLSASDAAPTPLAIVGYQEPAMQPRIRYAPTSDYVHGEMALGFTWQDTMLNFDVAPIGAASEGQARALIAELLASVARLAYTVSVAVNDAPVETWECKPGSLAPSGGRTYGNLLDHNPVWAVSLPCYPIRS